MTRLSGLLGDHAGQAVTYRRGLAELPITGVLTRPGSDTRASPLGTAAGLDLSDLDLVIKSVDLVLNDERLVPEVGDEVEAVLGGVAQLFAVRREPGGDCWRYADPLQTLVRIHLTHLGEASA